MQSVVSQLTKVVLIALSAITGLLLVILKMRGNKIASLEAQLLQSKDAATLAPVDAQLKEVESNVEKDRTAFSDALAAIKRSDS
jgi:cell division protein FtsB